MACDVKINLEQSLFLGLGASDCVECTGSGEIRFYCCGGFGFIII